MAKKETENKEEAVKDLKDLGAAVKDADTQADASATEDSKGETDSEAPVKRVSQIDKLGRAYATGRRKDAVARVWIKKGSGKVTVNGRDQATYFARQTQRLVLNQPFLKNDRLDHQDAMAF